MVHKDHRFESDTVCRGCGHWRQFPGEQKLPFVSVPERLAQGPWTGANEVGDTERSIASEIARRRANARENIAMSAPRQLIEGADAVVPVWGMPRGRELSIKNGFNLGSFATRFFGRR